ncbi:VTT domain-containing protein [Erythrobacter sp.]|uniref:VTT domain-containing protein n=1 Tax=Erythrobacter sp. TaxID=1042 RepID=UPI002EC45D36|nr:VTT domain-containing protein [Erythrobacter sp.]
MLAFLAVIGLLLLDSVAAIPHGFVGALAGAALPWAAEWSATWLGLMGASSISYAIGRFAGRPLAARIVGKADMAAAEKRAGAISALLLFATRPVPVVGEVILVASGIARYPFRRFVIAIGSANALLSLGYVGIGQFFGEGQNERIALIAAIGVPLLGAALYFAGVAFSRLARTS